MVSKRLAHMPHVSCFSFSIYVFLSSPPFISFSVHLVFITIPTRCISMPVPFFYHTFTHPNLLSHRYSQQSLSLSDHSCFLSISLPGCISSRHLFNPPSHLQLTLSFPPCVYPTQLPPHFPWKSLSTFSFL